MVLLVVFPREAGHQDCRHLGYVQKGFARIAFKAVEMSDYKLRLKILYFLSLIIIPITTIFRQTCWLP